MKKSLPGVIVAFALLCAAHASAPSLAHAQERGNSEVRAGAEVVLADAAKAEIREYYRSHQVSNAKPLPPGIRKNLARGKPLPPGIAKRAAPADLHSRVQIPAGYDLIEVGLDVVLVDAATQVIHEVLMDVIR